MTDTRQKQLLGRKFARALQHEELGKVSGGCVPELPTSTLQDVEEPDLR